VALVAGVIVAHVTMAWTGLGGWVFDEPPVREPLRSVLLMAAIIGVLFGMPLFFLVAGMFTPASLQRKGLRRFAVDRTVRLLVPVVLFVLLLTPSIEYVDPSNAGWSRRFWAFVPHVWWPWPPPPGPTWFLGVPLVFSLTYAVVRTMWPRRTAGPVPLRGWQLVAAVATVAAASYMLRLAVPLGKEIGHVTVAQTPGWVAGFALGVLGGERDWYQPVEPNLARRVRRVAWAAMATCSGGGRASWSRRARTWTCSPAAVPGSRWCSPCLRARSW
jgi:glucan biosynthesis protein C